MIPIKICFPHHGVISINVPLSAVVGSLNPRYPGRDFIFNGERLNSNNTFGFYGIQANDIVIGLPNELPFGTTERWLAMTKDAESLLEKARLTATSAGRMEASRIRDIRALKLEMRPRRFRKCFQSILPMITGNALSNFTTVIPDPPHEVSTQALPMML
jgi:hypothetical protein